MPGFKLYELPRVWDEIRTAIAQEDGEIPPAIEAAIDQFQGNIEDKTDAICALIREHEADAFFHQGEADAQRSKAATAQRKADHLKDYLRRNLELMGIPKVISARFRAALVVNSIPSIKFEGEAEHLPSDFQERTITANTKAAREAYKRGETLPDGLTVTLGRHLRIT